jgi:hypothetical protein
MKNLAENLTGLLYGKPVAGIAQENETLDKILRQWVPELLEYPEQLERIRQYIQQDHPDLPAGDNNLTQAVDLERSLSGSPPFLTGEKIEQLMLILTGMKAAMAHYDLRTGHELTAMVQAHKAGFLSKLEHGMQKAVGESDNCRAARESRESRKS